MKCRDCNCCRKGWFDFAPDVYVCIGTKEPFVINDINRECTEYPNKKAEINVESAIAHFKYGISHDMFKSPVAEYAQMAVDALEKSKNDSYESDLKMIKVNLIKKLRAKQRGHIELYDEYMDSEEYRNAQLLEEVIDLVKEIL